MKKPSDLVLVDPLVRAVLARFPGAEIIAVRQAFEPPAPVPDEPAEAPADEREQIP